MQIKQQETWPDTTNKEPGKNVFKKGIKQLQMKYSKCPETGQEGTQKKESKQQKKLSIR